MHQHQHQQQRVASTPNGTYGYAGYNSTSNPHGARGGSMSGRFAHSQANGGSGEEYNGYSGQEGQYYSSNGDIAGQSGSYYTSGASGAMDRTTGATGQAQGTQQAGGPRRKMW
jgi:hypothetical protein